MIDLRRPLTAPERQRLCAIDLGQAERPIRLSLVTETFVPEVNGVAMTLSRLVDGLRDRGHRVEVVRPRLPEPYHPGCGDGRGRHTIHRPGIPIPNYPQLRIGLPSTATLRASWRRNRPDVVHIATEGPMGLSALHAAHGLGLPVTSSFHTNFDQYTAHYKFGFMKRVVASYLRWLHNRSSCTMVPTLKQAKELKEDGYQRVRILSRGLDDRLFHPGRRSAELRRKWGASDNTLILTVVGRVAAEKNLPLAVTAFQAVRKQVPDSKLVIVGDGPARPQFEQIEGVICAGMRCGADLAAHYASADMFVFPSTTETYGNVTVEAMASGLAVVGFNYAAAEELIRHDKNGITVPFDDDIAFIRETVRLAQDVDLRRKLGCAAIAVTRSRRWANVIGAFERYLYEALDNCPHTNQPERNLV